MKQSNSRRLATFVLGAVMTLGLFAAAAPAQAHDRYDYGYGYRRYDPFYYDRYSYRSGYSKRRDGDRDGVKNRWDKDIDNDGRRNRYDKDRDGDGIRNKRDGYPSRRKFYRRRR
jgi:hypothetical protein